MLSPGLSITGFGMVTSLGHAVTACAGQRAGMSRAAPLSFTVFDSVAKEAEPVIGHAVGDFTRGFSEVGLAVRLASLALADLFERTPLETDELARTAVLVNLGSGFYFRCVDEARTVKGGRTSVDSVDDVPESAALTYDATLPLYTRSIIAKSFRVLGLPAPEPGRQQVVFEDQAGLGTLVARAHSLLLDDSRVTACLIGGVDSLVEPRWLRACAELRVLKTPLTPVGLVPGEAACFLLLEKDGTRRQPMALLRSYEHLREPGHRFSDPLPRGRKLAEVVRGCLAAYPEARTAGLLCDLNGDDVRAADFGHALVQLQQDRFRPRTTTVPAISFGDTRAASGFIGSCVALQAFARGYASSRDFVISSASDDGSRSAVLLTNPQGATEEQRVVG